MRLIGVNGVARSGKDTLAGFLENHHDYKRISFAAPIRAFISRLTGISVDDLTDGPLKEQPIDWLGGRSPREMMQTLGTEWGRSMVNPDLWLLVAKNEIDKAKKEGYAGVVISDVRFDNEARFVRDLGGEVVRVTRPGVAAVNAHASEQGISDDLVDVEIDNSGTLRYLAIQAEILAVN